MTKTNIRTNARSHVILFSSEMILSYEKIIDYYKLRFQIEFNFRDAKQFWGLEDFMNLSQTVKMWDSEYTVGLQHLKSYKYLPAECEQMQVICDGASAQRS